MVTTSSFPRKEGVLALAALSNVLFFATFFSVATGLCSEFKPDCYYSYHLFSLIICWAPVLLLFSLITYKKDARTFNAWAKFAMSWIVVTSLVILLVPTQQDIYSADWKQLSWLGLNAIFLGVSTYLVFAKK